jgi:hypothetical protein
MYGRLTIRPNGTGYHLFWSGDDVRGALSYDMWRTIALASLAQPANLPEHTVYLGKLPAGNYLLERRSEASELYQLAKPRKPKRLQRPSR